MLVHHLRRRPNFKTTKIQRLHDSYVMSGVNASATPLPHDTVH